MNAAVDIGNSSAKVGFFQESELAQIAKCSPLELADLLIKSSVKEVIISSVQPLEKSLISRLEVTPMRVLKLTADTPMPFEINYETPETIGVDRLAAAAGAILHSDKDVLVIDMGTCVTYDLITQSGTYQGGIISPGFRMRLKAMNAFTAGLPLVDPIEKPVLVGKSTEACLQSGAYHGLLGEINQIIKYYSQQIEDLAVIICGGDAEYFEKKIEMDTFVLPNLVLEGLNSILRFNAVKE